MNSTRSQLLRICGIPFSQSAIRPAASSIPSLVRHAQPLATRTVGNIARPNLISSPCSSPYSTSTSTQSQTPASDATSTTTTTSSSATTLPPGVSRSFGTVISAGRMQRTVRVEQIRTKFDNSLQKRFLEKKIYMVSDPRDSLREGDKIEFWSGRRVSEHVRHVVERIIVPFGSAIEDRPPVMTYAERVEEELSARKNRRLRRLERMADGQPIDAEVTGELRMGKLKQRVIKRLEAEKEKQKQSNV
ncbi:hypothetical protein MGYG_00360 [Nannizzia gypsea CBS 118893]|uniref:Uncharacterized protein n=1 Tax=Arthroderma gypseum (strain ATCC MYA-4604 / CBS 118893) TaxID=535722 RepID=E5QZ88_ARTGP|nr:hypothetical protein MGYG_00360 [Nannizzia gypsea CBS 118893]EFQ97320.1 hypothetical protein MGYG_00360 [Nannizzia gypsea CBS 118893]